MDKLLSELSVGDIIKLHNDIAIVVRVTKKRCLVCCRNDKSMINYKLGKMDMLVQYLGKGNIIYDFGEL